MEELQQSSSKRISINLVLGTPVVQVPLTSKSRESFVLLLGRLRVENSFHVIGEHAPGTSPLPVCDKMDVKLDNISLCRCVDSCILFYMQPRCCNVYCMSTTTHNLGAVMCTYEYFIAADKLKLKIQWQWHRGAS